MGQALYRKYRSRSLTELVGQDHITQALGNALKEERVSHAYLFTGPRGVGKTSVARILAHEINQLPYDAEGLHLDIIEIDAASNNGVEDVRDLREKVMLAPSQAKYKVYIIDEVHMLSNAAFNALLKTLEEPPAHVVFILATTEAHKLPATIISRTQRFHFQPVTAEKVVEHLRAIAQKEDIAITDDALRLVADYGEGSFRDSISLLDQLRGDQQITPEVVEQTLGIAPSAAIGQLIAALDAGDTANVLRQYEALLASGITAQALSQQLIRALRPSAAAQPEFYTLIEALIEVPRAYSPRLKLEIILAQFALRHADQTTSPPPPPSAPPEPPKPSKPAKKTTPAQSPVEKPPKIAEKVTVEQPQPPTKSNSTQLEALTDDQWQAVMLAAKHSGPTLNTVIRQSIPHFDPEKQLLTLTFRFGVHQRQLEESKHKQLFFKILQEVLGTVPQMQIVVNKQAVKHIKPAETHAELNNEAPHEVNDAHSVMGLMGGGEVVSV